MTPTEAKNNIGRKVRIVGDDIAMREDLRPYVVQGMPLIVKDLSEDEKTVVLRDRDGEEFTVPTRNIVQF